MKLSEAIRKAVRNRDAAQALAIGRFLMDGKGLSYRCVLGIVQKAVPGLEPVQWDELIYEGELAQGELGQYVTSARR